jgi:hypothetical protein
MNIPDPDLDFFTHPGSRGQKPDPESRIRNTVRNPMLCPPAYERGGSCDHPHVCECMCMYVCMYVCILCMYVNKVKASILDTKCSVLPLPMSEAAAVTTPI